MAATLFLLVGKNIHLEVRMWRRLLLELVIVFIIFFLIALNFKTKYNKFELESSETVHFYEGPTLHNLDILRNEMGFSNRLKIIYAPKTIFTDALMESVSEKLSLNKTQGYTTEEELESVFDKRNMLAGVVFNDLYNDEVPINLSVTLRFPSIFRTFDDGDEKEILWITRHCGILDTENFENGSSQIDLYMREGFSQLQHAIFIEWLRNLTDGTVAEVSMSSFRFKIDDNACQSVSYGMLPVLLCYFVFLVPFVNIIRKYGHDVEDNILVSHWKYGYSYLCHWRAHFIVSFLHLLLITIMILILTRIRYSSEKDAVNYPNIPIGIFFIFCILFNIALITTAIVIVTLLRRVHIAVLFAITWWLINFVIFYPLQSITGDVSDPSLAVASIIFFNNMFPFGMMFMDSIDSNSSDGHWILILITLISVIFQLILLMIIQLLFPYKYTEHRAFNFLCLFERFKIRKSQKSGADRQSMDERESTIPNQEVGSSSAIQMMQVQNVSYYKKGSKRQKLKNISLTVYKGEITVIVGPQNSGKSTLLSIMAGLRIPAFGTVIYEKIDMMSNWKDVRNKIDLALPSNPLYGYFTAEEMLVYYLRIKMVQKDEQRLIMEVIKWQEAMRPVIPDKDVYVKNMTFEQKRILYLCCVLSYRTKVVLLDEPTAHMHNYEKRVFWDIINKNKPDKAIVLTTDSLDEAEAVADRIAVLSSGSLKAYGTPFYLKTEFGNGYDLIILKSVDSSTPDITDLIQKFIPNVTPILETTDQVIYKLPANQRSDYQHMLIHLEKESANLGITNIKVYTASLNNVIMDVGGKHGSKQVISENRTSIKVVQNSETHRNKMQICAIIYKKILQQRPTLFTFLLLVLTLFMIIIVNQLTKKSWGNHETMNITLGPTQNSEALFKQEVYKTYEIRNLQDESVDANTLTYMYSNEFITVSNVTFEEYMKQSDIVFESFGGMQDESADNQSYIAYANQHVFHSAALALNLVHNRIISKIPELANRSIIISNKPMPLSLNVKMNQLHNKRTQFIDSISIGTIVPIVISSFILFIMADKRYHIWILQSIAGMNMGVYFLTSLLFDLLFFLLFVLIMLALLALTGTVIFSLESILVSILLFFFYGVAALSMTYFIAVILNATPKQAYLISVIIHLITGSCFTIIYWDLFETKRLLFYVMAIFPTFSLLDGISNVFAESRETTHCNERCKQIKDCTSDIICDMVPMCCKNTFFQIERPGIMLAILFMTFASALFLFASFWVLLHRKEKRYHCKRNPKELYTECYSYDDKDVVEMRQRLAELDLSEMKKLRFAVDQLENEIPKKPKNGLTTVSFTAEGHKCLGIYGGHHSGKSHLIKQLIGEDSFCFGDVYFRGVELKHNPKEYKSHVGYCPQDHGLMYYLTPRQTLKFFCMVSGIPASVASQRIKELEASLDMSQYMDRKIYRLKADRKRKVNIAVTFITYNKIVFLDEPARGMPYKAQREIWNVIRYACFCGNVVIITSSETMELLALTDNVMLFDKGEIWGIGNLRYLLAKCTRGFYLEVKLSREGSDQIEIQQNSRKDLENLNRFISFIHEDSLLISRTDNCFKFYCPVDNVLFSYLFGTLEKNKVRLNITEYTISGGTLPDIMHNTQKIRSHLKSNG